MKFGLLAALSFVVVLVQTAAAPVVIAGIPVLPDLPLLVVLAWGMAFGPLQALLAACVTGLLADASSVAPLGTHVVALGAGAGTVWLKDSDFMTGRLGFALAAGVAGTGLYYLALALVLQLTGGRVDWGNLAAHVLPPAVAMNAMLSPLVLWGGSRGLARLLPRDSGFDWPHSLR